MSHKTNPKQLVLRRDTATGMTMVGWSEDMPVGRFEHIELICESTEGSLPETDTEYYACFQSAMQNARQANRLILEQQARQHQGRGRYIVPFELGTDKDALKADSFGNYTNAAMQLCYQLTRNRKQAWAVVRGGMAVHVRARYPKKVLDEFTYQVWYNKQIHELNQITGTLLEGHLMICESGLWFEAKNDYPV